MAGVFGTVDGFEAPRRLVGWVTTDTQDATRKIDVVVTRDHQVIGHGQAALPRSDLAHIADGHIAYDFELTVPLAVPDFLSDTIRVDAFLGDALLGPIPFGTKFRGEIAAAELARSFSGLAAVAALLGGPDLGPAIEHSLPAPAYGARDTCLALMWALREGRAAAASVLRRFENLGANCEFGLVQRRFGVEGVGLFRWGASWRGLAGIIEGFRARFEGAGTHVSLHTLGTEYIAVDDRYQIVFHTDRHAGRDDPDLLLRNERVRIPYLARNIVENVEAASTLFVYQDGGKPTLPELLGLLAALREIGPVTLLWVTLAQRPDHIGRVEWAAPNLLRGYIDRFSPTTNIYEYCSYDLWVHLCTEALRLHDAA